MPHKKINRKRSIDEHDINRVLDVRLVVDNGVVPEFERYVDLEFIPVLDHNISDPYHAYVLVRGQWYMVTPLTNVLSVLGAIGILLRP